MNRFVFFSLGLILLVMILAGCALRPSSNGPLPQPTIDQAKLANPAAGYCEEQGFTYEIRQDAQGNEVGVCIFDDGTECDAWAYFRGECGQDKLGKLALNLVERAGLEETQRIEVWVPTSPLVAFDVANPNPQAEMKLLTTIENAADIQSLLAPLDAPRNLRPPVRCPIAYEVRFIKPRGDEVFWLGDCGLIGEQSYLQDKILPLPTEFIQTFNALIRQE